MYQSLDGKVKHLVQTVPNPCSGTRFTAREVCPLQHLNVGNQFILDLGNRSSWGDTARLLLPDLAGQATLAAPGLHSVRHSLNFTQRKNIRV